MKTLIVTGLIVTGIALITAGVAFIFWPAALVVSGAAILTCGVLINIPEEQALDQLQIVDESEEPIATVARVHG